MGGGSFSEAHRKAGRRPMYRVSGHLHWFPFVSCRVIRLKLDEDDLENAHG
jgi:hypothetical protein